MPTPNELFPQQLKSVTLPEMIIILFVIKSIKSGVVKLSLISESMSYNIGWNSFTNNRGK